jgi:hypothetical protein
MVRLTGLNPEQRIVSVIVPGGSWRFDPSRGILDPAPRSKALMRPVTRANSVGRTGAGPSMSRQAYASSIPRCTVLWSRPSPFMALLHRCGDAAVVVLVRGCVRIWGEHARNADAAHPYLVRISGPTVRRAAGGTRFDQFKQEWGFGLSDSIEVKRLCDATV